MTRYAVRTRADSPELRKAAMAIEQSAWSALGFLNFTRAHFAFYQQLLENHADCQLCLVDEETGYPVAVGNCVPLTCDFDNLPPEGWDWIVETAANDRGRPANALGALAISVPGIHRGKGVARMMIEEFRKLAERKGLDGVIAPVRPSESTATRSFRWTSTSAGPTIVVGSTMRGCARTPAARSSAPPTAPWS